MAFTHAGTFSPFEPMSEDALLSLGSMEGLAEAPRAKPKPWRTLGPGYAAAGLIAIVSYGIHYLPFAPFVTEGRRPISASMIAIAAAVLVRNLAPVPASFLAGCKHIVRNLIPLAIVFTGAGLDLAQVVGAGPRAVGIIVASLLVAAAAAIWLGRVLGLSSTAAALLGSGTAICGTSAIVAAAPLIEARDEDVTLSVGSVSLLGLILMFLLPLAGAAFELSQRQFGVWAGVSIHAVPQVVAAGFTYGPEAGTIATLTKLARVAMLAPFLVALTLLYGRKGGDRVSAAKLVPGFLWGFLGLAVLHTLRLTPALTWEQQGVKLPLPEIGNWLLTLAMAAIGLEVNLRLLVHAGGRALLAGAGATVILCAASLWLVRLLM